MVSNVPAGRVSFSSLKSSRLGETSAEERPPLLLIQFQFSQVESFG